MVREDELPEKKSWFSRKKKPTLSTGKVSRPPSAASFPSHHRKTSSQSTLDDDLPPREPHSVNPSPAISAQATRAPGTPTAASMKDDPEEVAIPKHAGFDLGAIKSTIQEAVHHPDELQMPAPNRPMPFIPPPTHRTESAPPPTADASPLHTPRSSFDSHEPPVAGPSSSRGDLSSTLSRSLSLNDMRAGTDDENLTSPGERTPSAGQPFRVPPPPSFGSAAGSLWPAASDRAAAPFGAGSLNTFGQDPFEARSNAFGSHSLMPHPLNHPYSPPDSAGLSFGGSDGSITFMPSPVAVPADPPDPWGTSAPGLGGYGAKKATASSLNVANPWQS